MLIQDFYNLIAVVSCPKCGQDPDHMTLETLHDDHFICTCDNCNSRIKVTYKTVTGCELGRYKEHSLGERNGHMTKCEYWEAKE